MPLRFIRTCILIISLSTILVACANRGPSLGKIEEKTSFTETSPGGLVVFFVEILPDRGRFLGRETVSAQGLNILFTDTDEKAVLQFYERGDSLNRIWDGTMGSGSFPQIGRVAPGEIRLVRMSTQSKYKATGLWNYPEEDDIDLSLLVKPGVVNYAGHFSVDLYAMREETVIDVRKREVRQERREGLAIVEIQRDDAAARAFIAENYPNVTAPLEYVGPEPRMRARTRRP